MPTDLIDELERLKKERIRIDAKGSNAEKLPVDVQKAENYTVHIGTTIRRKTERQYAST